MLHRPASAPAWAPRRWAPLRRLTARLGAITGPSSGLLHYVLIAAVLCAIGCAYLWRVNELSTIHERTLELQGQARRLEEKTVALSVQLSQWNSPAYVDKRSIEEGYVAASEQLIEAPAVANAAAAPSAGPVTVH